MRDKDYWLMLEVPNIFWKIMRDTAPLRYGGHDWCVGVVGMHFR